jgi:hypothetical protein
LKDKTPSLLLTLAGGKDPAPAGKEAATPPSRLVDPSVDPASARSLLTAARVGEGGKAREDVERAITVDPKGGPGHAAKGLLSLAQGREAEAEKLYERAVALDGTIGTSIGRLKEAVKEKGGTREDTTLQDPGIPESFSSLFHLQGSTDLVHPGGPTEPIRGGPLERSRGAGDVDCVKAAK